MTTTPSHAARWTLRSVFADLFPARPAKETFDLMTHREASARALFGEHCKWDPKQMAEYDESPMLQGGWGAVADRRIAHAKSQDRHVAAFHGIKDADWIHLPSLVQRDHREAFYAAKGL